MHTRPRAAARRAAPATSAQAAARLTAGPKRCSTEGEKGLHVRYTWARKGGETAEVFPEGYIARGWYQNEWGAAPFKKCADNILCNPQEASLLRPSLRQPLGGVTIGRRSAAEGDANAPSVTSKTARRTANTLTNASDQLSCSWWTVVRAKCTASWLLPSW